MRGENVAIERTAALSSLLAQAQAAHGVYETTELQGVYDQDWPRWYAAYIVEQGIGEVVGHPVTTDDLARLLTTANDEYQQSAAKASEPWADWTARRIGAEL
jgi:hypothetical protein